MSSGVVLSIHSVHAQNIYAGIKRYEYRTRRPKRNVDYIALYETGNAQAITGVAKIAGILESTPQMIWDLTKSFAGISCEYFKNYFSGKKKAIAYCISEVIPFKDPVVLSEVGINRAPQSFQYIDESEVMRLLEVEIENKKPLQPRFFIGGVHGVGKSTFGEKMAEDMGLSFYSASKVILDYADLNKSKKVAASEVKTNQDYLLAGLLETDWFAMGGLLDGHFALRSENDEVTPISVEVFSQLDLDAMIVLTAKASSIADRLEKRDGVSWDKSLIEKMQQDELINAKNISEQLGIPLSIIKAKA